MKYLKKIGDNMQQDICNCKKVKRTADEKSQLSNRLARIEGQIKGLRKMLENDCYCNDILIQSNAICSALSAFNRQLISSHIKHCVKTELMQGNDAIVEELVDTLKKLMK
ncbi:MAG: metal-sensing transcriptional repressor [Christensenellales bacterium]